MTATGNRTAPARPATASGLARYRRDRQALELAAAGVWDIETTSAIAATAQNEWWHRVLARVDAGVDDDLAAMAPEARAAAVRAAWEAQRCDTPAYLDLASLGAGTAVHDATQRRYARLLALFAGTAAPTDDDDTAAEAGLALVRELSGAV